MEQSEHSSSFSATTEPLIVTDRLTYIHVEGLQSTADIAGAVELAALGDFTAQLRQSFVSFSQVVKVLCQLVTLVSGARTAKRDLSKLTIRYRRVAGVEKMIELLLDAQLSNPVRESSEHLLRNSDHIKSINRLVEVLGLLAGSEDQKLTRNLKGQLEALLRECPVNSENFWERLCNLPDIFNRSKLQQFQQRSLQLRLSQPVEPWNAYVKTAEDVSKCELEFQDCQEGEVVGRVLQHICSLLRIAYASEGQKFRLATTCNQNTNLMEVVQFELDCGSSAQRLTNSSVQVQPRGTPIGAGGRAFSFRISYDRKSGLLRFVLATNIVAQIMVINLYYTCISALMGDRCSNVSMVVLDQTQFPMPRALQSRRSETKETRLCFVINQPVWGLERMFHLTVAAIDRLIAADVALFNELKELGQFTLPVVLANRLRDSLPLELQHYQTISNYLSEGLRSTFETSGAIKRQPSQTFLFSEEEEDEGGEFERGHIAANRE